MKKLFAIAILAVLISCNNGETKTETTKTDSAAHNATDTTKKMMNVGKSVLDTVAKKMDDAAEKVKDTSAKK